jgi:hypothetical protein
MNSALCAGDEYIYQLEGLLVRYLRLLWFDQHLQQPIATFAAPEALDSNNR